MKTINFIILILTSCLLLIVMSLKKPVRYGDGWEYYLITESLFNHGTPDLQDKDKQTLELLKSKYNMPGNTPAGYYQAKDKKWYNFHFWGYPLISIPVKYFLHVSQANELKVFQITNAILFSVLLFFIFFVSKFSERQKCLFSLLVIFSPGFWFIPWTSTEFFSYTFVTIALVYMNARNWPAAVFCAAIASTQNQPSLFFTIFLWLKGAQALRTRPRSLLALTIAALPAIIPFIFFYIKFGDPSLLLSKITYKQYFSLLRVSEMFFDLNIGMLPYIPLSLLLFLFFVAQDLVKRRWSSTGLQFFLVIVIMMLFCTLTDNWNHGTTGPMRYGIQMMPLIFYSLVTREGFSTGPIRRVTFLEAMVFFAIILQIMIVFGQGGFAPTENYLAHSPAARFVLNHVPFLYNPSMEIFRERTCHRETEPFSNIAVYRYQGHCRKALIHKSEEPALPNVCADIPKHKFPARDGQGEWFYVNF